MVPARITTQQTTVATVGTEPSSKKPNSTDHAEYEMLSAMAFEAPIT